MFTERYGLIPYIKEITFRIEKFKARNLNLIISDSVKGHALLHVDSFSLCTYFGEKILNLVSQQYVTQHENLNLKKNSTMIHQFHRVCLSAPACILQAARQISIKHVIIHES